MEYLRVNNILLNRSKDINSLGDNVWHTFNELAKTQGNPLFARIIDPANFNNILSDLLTVTEKNKIISQVQTAFAKHAGIKLFGNLKKNLPPNERNSEFRF